MGVCCTVDEDLEDADAAAAIIDTALGAGGAGRGGTASGVDDGRDAVTSDDAAAAFVVVVVVDA